MLKCPATFVISEPGLSEKDHLLRVIERTYRIIFWGGETKRKDISKKI
jgi:hypothetical protein